jgi:pyruvate dehydrogenase E1 component alpha subunit
MSDAQKYRTKEEVNEYRKIDPITQVKKVILENDFASEQEISSIDASVKTRVLECEKFAEDSPYPEKSVMYDAVYEQDNYKFISHKLK